VGPSQSCETPGVLIFLLATAALGWGSDPGPPLPGCSKNVSFAIAEGGQPVPAIPKFAVKWIDKMSHQPDSKAFASLRYPRRP
jgi:hypothetical protein